MTPVTRTCSKCGEAKSLLEFYPRSDRPSFRSDCKACVNARSRAYYRENAESVKTQVRATYYSITPSAIADMREAQGNRCAVCGVSERDSGRTLHVDHDHACCPGKRSCGKCVRGLLCHNCNIGLGAFGDSVEKMQAAIAYLGLTLGNSPSA